MDPVVHLRSLVCLIGRFPVLAGVDLDVDRGEIVRVAGPNGAGKTTLLRVCAGLLPVTAGAGSVLGVDLVTDRVAVRRRVGLMGHTAGLYEDLSVRDNLRFWARAAGATAAHADAAFARLRLPDRLGDVTFSHLSAGQRRRVSLAALVARRPELWLLDEPHAGLDADGRETLDGLVREAADAGATVLLASHEIDHTAGLVDRTVTLVGGLVRAARARDPRPDEHNAPEVSDVP